MEKEIGRGEGSKAMAGTQFGHLFEYFLTKSKAGGEKKHKNVASEIKIKGWGERRIKI